MTLPISPASLALSQVNVELGFNATAQISVGSTPVRTLAGVLIGDISFSDLYGKSVGITIDYLLVGGLGTEGNGSVGGGDGVSGQIVISNPVSITVGARAQSTVGFGKTAANGAAGHNGGSVHWGWDSSTNCDAWPGGQGGSLNGGARNPGGNPDAREYHAQGGNGGAGFVWPITGASYGGGQGGYRSGAGGGNNGSNGAGYSQAGTAIISYVSATQLLVGGTVTQGGGRFYHFFAPGTHTIGLGFQVEYLLIGGGGSGGGTHMNSGGGGGAGQWQEGSTVLSLSQVYKITVGDGGQDSSFAIDGGAALITAVKGGNGGSWESGGGGGGSGGGAGGGTSGQTGGAPVDATKGNRGGNTSGGTVGGGGGGAESGGEGAGGDRPGTRGGDGKITNITGAPLRLAAGGGGMGSQGTGAGGLGGGGTGGTSNGSGTAGAANTGSGGGGGYGGGGSGVCYIRYKGAQKFSGGDVSTITDNGVSYTLHAFKTVGATELIPGKLITVEYLLVGGGGGGGANAGGAGGAGGLLQGTIDIAEVKSYTVKVGVGGYSGDGGGWPGNGGDTSFAGLVAKGGGAGGRGGDGNGAAGGSGGGKSATGGGGAGTPGQGHDGSHHVDGGSGGGGGGAGSAGIQGSGGAGVASSITGVSVTYAAGGNGWSQQSGGANTGNGAGGGSPGNLSGTGGTGFAAIRYPGAQKFNGGQVSTIDVNGTPYTLHQFKSTGDTVLTPILG